MQLLARAQLLAAFLSGNSPEACCPRCLASFADRLFCDTAPGDIDRLLAAAHPFLNACVAAVLQLSGNDVASFRTGFEAAAATCTRAHAVPRLCMTEGQDVVHIVVDAACQCLHACFTKATQCAHDRASSARVAFDGPSGYWPTEAAQLFPSGAADILRALVNWGNVLESGNPLHVVAGFAAFARPTVFTTIMRTPGLHTAIGAAIIDRLRTHEGADRAELDLPLDERSLASRARTQSILSVAMLLGMIETGPDAGVDDVLILLGPRELEAFRAVVGALHFLEGSPTPGAGYSLLAEVANRLQQHLKLPVSALPQRALEDRMPDMALLDMVNWVLVLLRLKRSRWCSGPGCGRFVHQLAPGAAMRPCSGCGIVHYCSSECQRRDWEGGRHATLCSIMSTLEQADLITDAFQAHSSDERDLVVKWALAHDVLAWEFKERARNLMAPRIMVTAFVLGGVVRDVRG